MTQPSFLSTRAVSLQPSMTLAITARAKELKKEGRDICSLSAGEPDFNTPDFIVEAAIKALKDGITRYGPAAGDPQLREAIAKKLTVENNVPTEKEEVLITNGGKQAIYNLLQVILNPGEEVLIPSPYWLSYPEIVKLAGAKPISIDSSAGNEFNIDFDLMESKINANTKLIILNSPNNPTGKIINRKELESIANILRKHSNIFVMTDEIYEHLLAEGEAHLSLAAIAPDLQNRIFTVNGFAKSWAMTGWRVGYLSGSKEIIQAACALQSQSTSNVCSFAQRGALAAIEGPRDCIDYMVEKYNYRRRLLVSGLKEIKELKLISPKGAFYAFPQIPIGGIKSIQFCKRALEDYGLALIPGIAFGDDNCIRISCAVSSKTIKDGINRLKSVVSSL